MTNKMTKKDWFATLATIVEGSDYENKDEALAFINHEVELLNNKSGKTTMTATQKENERVKGVILETLAALDRPVTITELQEANEELATLKNQKISALLRLLGEKGSGQVVKTYTKKVAYFSLAE